MSLAVMTEYDEATAAGPPDVPAILEGEVHLWIARMDAFPPDLEPLVATLPADEQATATRIRAPNRKRQFVLGRWVLRSLLGGYLANRGHGRSGRAGVAAEPFRYLPQGKPVLADEAAGLHFNIAHSGELIVAGFSASRPLGVDVERIRPVPSHAGIARTYFTEGERAWLDAMPECDREQAFLRLWTCREALTKAVGQGIALAWEDFEMAMGDGASTVIRPFIPAPASRESPATVPDPARWSVFHPPVPRGYVASIAVAGEEPALRTYEWTAGK